MVDRRAGGDQTAPQQTATQTVVFDDDKIPFIAQARSSADMTDGQKEFIRLYNLMRNKLIKHNLMEEKK